MKTKLAFILITLLGISYSLKADSKPVKASVKEATVFFTGAELIHNATATLTKGENEITIEGLSPNIDRNSLKIKASNGVLISTFEFSIDYLSDGKVTNNSITKRLQDSIEYYQDKLQLVNTELKINSDLSEILNKSTDKNVSGSEKGLGIDELVKTMDYYKSKKLELEKTLVKQKSYKDFYQKAIERLNNQLKQESVKNNKTSGVLKLSLTAPIATTSQFTISYYTASANWIPYYDINIPSTDKPIQIASKAKIKQTTGLDWNKIKLILSTATPSNGKIAPLFNTWFLRDIGPVCAAYERGAKKQLMGNSSQMGYSYADQSQSAIEVTMHATELRQREKISNESPLYIVDGIQMEEQEFSTIDPNMVKDVQVLKDATSTAAYGSRASNGVVMVTLKSNMDDYVTSNENDLNTTYDIEIPFSVPGNGKEQSLDLKNQEIQAAYKYYCAPKLDTETYLLAEISNWEKLNLLSGKANITYDGTYIGESIINTKSTQKLLTLTLGSDKRVAVKREKLRDYSSTKFLGNDVKQIFTYKLTVKNNQNKAINMVLKDQYPISTQKNIEVELLTKDTTTPTINVEDLGVITWEETFQPGETKVYQISYSVKYPKNINLGL